MLTAIIMKVFWICWLSILFFHDEGDGFVPNNVVMRGIGNPQPVDWGWSGSELKTNDGGRDGGASSSALYLFGTRKRIKRVYQSLRKRLNRRKTEEDNDAFITAASIDSIVKFQPTSAGVVASPADRKALVSALQQQGQAKDKGGGEFAIKFEFDRNDEMVENDNTLPAATTAVAITAVSASDQLMDTSIPLSPPLGLLSEEKKTTKTNGEVVLVVTEEEDDDKENIIINGNHQQETSSTTALPPTTNGTAKSIKNHDDVDDDDKEKPWNNNMNDARQTNGETSMAGGGGVVPTANGNDDLFSKSNNGKISSSSSSREVANGLPKMMMSSSNNDTMSTSTLTTTATATATGRETVATSTATPTMLAVETEREEEVVVVVAQQEQQTHHLEQLYTLPPIDRNLTTLETEFREMLEFFCQFTQADLYTIRDPRVRAIMEGVVSGSNEEPVYRAFEVLFEDLLPLRLAGRMIFSKLKTLMIKAQGRAQREVEDIVNMTGLSTERVQVSRLAFLTLAIPTEQEHYDKEAHLTLDQLVDCGLAEKAMIAMGHDDDDLKGFLNHLDPNKTGKVTFPELIAALSTTAEETCAVVDRRCDPAVVLQAVVSEMEPTMANTTIKQLDKKRQEFSNRYDSMVAAFQEWDDIVPEGEGRRLDVLRGCFVGAANQRVVEALRVVYLDYAALRLAGNSIFAIMKTLVGTIRKRKSNHH